MLEGLKLRRQLAVASEVGPVELLREPVMPAQAFLALFRFGRIAHFELLVRQLEVEIEHLLRFGGHLQRVYRLAAGDRFGDLDGQDALALAGIGKEDRQLALGPELAKEHFGHGLLFGRGDAFVDAADVKEVGIGEQFGRVHIGGVLFVFFRVNSCKLVVKSSPFELLGGVYLSVIICQLSSIPGRQVVFTQKDAKI